MIKTLVGYVLCDGMTPETYDDWLWNIHVPDLLANPHIDRIVFNTVIREVRTTSGGAGAVPPSIPLFRIAEMQFADEAAYERYGEWFAEHPIPAERGPNGRTDFRFYLLCSVAVAER